MIEPRSDAAEWAHVPASRGARHRPTCPSPNSARRDSTASSSRSTTAGRRSTSPTCRPSVPRSSRCGHLGRSSSSACRQPGCTAASPYRRPSRSSAFRSSSRIAVLADSRATVREVRIDDAEVVEFGDIRCTSVGAHRVRSPARAGTRERRGRTRRRRADRRTARRSRSTFASGSMLRHGCRTSPPRSRRLGRAETLAGSTDWNAQPSLTR